MFHKRFQDFATRLHDTPGPDLTLYELSDRAYQMMMLWEAISEVEKIIVIDIHRFLGHHDHNV